MGHVFIIYLKTDTVVIDCYHDKIDQNSITEVTLGYNEGGDKDILLRSEPCKVIIIRRVGVVKRPNTHSHARGIFQMHRKVSSTEGVRGAPLPHLLNCVKRV